MFIEDALQPNPYSHLSGKVVLFIDDEEIVLNTSKKLLRKMGSQVITADNPREGLRIYNEQWSIIDIVIIDLVMPIMDGREVMKSILSMNPKAEIYICSGFIDHEFIDDLLLEGARGFIPKPFNLDVLSEQISK